MKTSKAIARHHATTGRTPGPSAIRVVVMDGHHTVCHTEATLDVWWANLPADRKAEIYEQDLDHVTVTPGVCQYCFCTQERGCNPPCCWINAEHTVCSADDCVTRYEAAVYGEVLDRAPGATAIRQTSALQLVHRPLPDLLAQATNILSSFQQLASKPLAPVSQEARHADL